MSRARCLLLPLTANAASLASRTVRRAVPISSVTRPLTTSRTATKQVSGDFRAPSAQIFTPAEVQAGIRALVEQGYDGESIWEQRVVWGDHDQFQHVNNVHFVRWFESSRMFFCEAMIKLKHPKTGEKLFTEERAKDVTRGTGKSVILANMHVRYRRPVVYPDTILVGQACELPLGKDRFVLRAVAYSLAQKRIVAISKQECVTYDYTELAKCDIPSDIKQALEAKGTQS